MIKPTPSQVSLFVPGQRTGVIPRKINAESKPCIDPARHGNYEENMPVLKNVYVFEGLPREALKEMTREMVSRKYQPGEIVVREGTSNNFMFVLYSGRVEVIKGLGTESEKLIACLGEHEIFGEMSLLEALPRTASIRVSATAEIYSISAAALLRISRKYPEAYSKLLFNLAKSLSKRLRQTMEQASD